MVPVQRDIQERGRTLESVLEQYTKYVKPAFEEFTLPVSTSQLVCSKSHQGKPALWTCIHTRLQTKKYADVIIPRGAENDGMIAAHLLRVRGNEERCGEGME